MCMTRMFRLFAAMAFCLTMCSKSSLAQAQPSLQETTTWMQTFLEGHGCTDTSFNNEVGLWGSQVCSTVTETRGCVFTFTLKHSYWGNGGLSPTSETDVWDLTRFDPSSVKQTAFSTGAYGPLGHSVRASWSNGSGFQQLAVDAPDSGDRVVKALVHAIELCGGKKPAF
jgi:hypothetical protein